MLRLHLDLFIRTLIVIVRKYLPLKRETINEHNLTIEHLFRECTNFNVLVVAKHRNREFMMKKSEMLGIYY